MTGFDQPDVFAGIKEATRCPVVHPLLGRCGFVIGHDRAREPIAACGVALLEPDGRLALHLWADVDGVREDRRLEPGWWGISTRRLPWASGYTLPSAGRPERQRPIRSRQH